MSVLFFSHQSVVKSFLFSVVKFIGNCSTDVFQPRTATGNGIFLFFKKATSNCDLFTSVYHRPCLLLKPRLTRWEVIFLLHANSGRIIDPVQFRQHGVSFEVFLIGNYCSFFWEQEIFANKLSYQRWTTTTSLSTMFSNSFTKFPH